MTCFWITAFYKYLFSIWLYFVFFCMYVACFALRWHTDWRKDCGCGTVCWSNFWGWTTHLNILSDYWWRFCFVRLHCIVTFCLICTRCTGYIITIIIIIIVIYSAPFAIKIKDSGALQCLYAYIKLRVKNNVKIACFQLSLETVKVAADLSICTYLATLY